MVIEKRCSFSSSSWLDDGNSSAHLFPKIKFSERSICFKYTLYRPLSMQISTFSKICREVLFIHFSDLVTPSYVCTSKTINFNVYIPMKSTTSCSSKKVFLVNFHLAGRFFKISSWLGKCKEHLIKIIELLSIKSKILLNTCGEKSVNTSTK